jgi:hypothetical protein
MLSLRNWGPEGDDYYQTGKEAAALASHHHLPINEFNVANFT